METPSPPPSPAELCCNRSFHGRDSQVSKLWNAVFSEWLIGAYGK
jgi:DNA gyrase inhibitor GyrI